MPAFALNTPVSSSSRRKAPHPFYALNTFARGYVEAMFFTNGDTGDDRETLLNDWGVECLTAEAVADIAADCARFEAENALDLESAYALVPGEEGLLYGRNEIDEARAGNLFWYARQGHGVGWTDGGDEPALERLQEASRAFGEAYVEAYRRKIHHR